MMLDTLTCKTYNQNVTFVSNRVLFICGHNAGRSQMAEAFFNHFTLRTPLVEKWEAISAGTRPGETINPLVVQAMLEIGIKFDPTKHYPKGLNSDFIKKMGPSVKRVIIACDDTCILPSEIPTYVPCQTWNLPDPHHQPIEVVRKVRDLVRDKVKELTRDLGKTQ